MSLLAPLAWLWGKAMSRGEGRAGEAAGERVDFRSIECSGALVEDIEVASRYEGFASRDYVALGKEDFPEKRTFVSFRVRGAIVTQVYMVIDPAEKLLFINQTEPYVSSVAPDTQALFTEEGFTFSSDRVRHIPGRTAVIGGQIGSNYYHWVLDWCPRLILLQHLAPDVYHDPAVKLLIDFRAREEPFVSFLEAMNIAEERIIWADCSNDYLLEEAVLVSLPTQPYFFPELQDALARQVAEGLHVPDRPGKPRRIWISRQELPAPRRRVANMDAIQPVLDRFGFEVLVLEHMSLIEQVTAFAHAEIVMGVHGAGFVNMIFCPKGCRIAVIEKEFNLEFRIDHFVTTLALACGLHHSSIVAPPRIAGDVERDYWQRHAEDVEVDPGELAKLIEANGILPDPSVSPVSGAFPSST